MVKKQNFEQSLIRLEEVVSYMEKGDLPLDDMLKYFQEGIGLLRFCEGKLKETEQKIEVLLDDGNENNE